MTAYTHQDSHVRTVFLGTTSFLPHIVETINLEAIDELEAQKREIYYLVIFMVLIESQLLFTVHCALILANFDTRNTLSSLCALLETSIGYEVMKDTDTVRKKMQQVLHSERAMAQPMM